MDDLRNKLRAIPSIVGSAPGFDRAAAPEDPHDLLRNWLVTAIAAKVPEPHAMTLSTIGEGGIPDARVLVLKNLGSDGALEFATGDLSAKGRQLASNPGCALSFYWSPLARAIRIRGIAVRATSKESASDFLARGHTARVIALAGQQSGVLPAGPEQTRLLDEARAKLIREPETVDPSWTLWRVPPVSVEFWQGDSGREHLRLRYQRTNDGWTRTQMWA